MGPFLAQASTGFPNVSAPSTARIVRISRQEAEMLIRVVESVIDFSQSFPLEFHSYCPMKRWEEVLKNVGNGIAQIESQLATQTESVSITAETLLATMDLEECVSGARDARLSSAKTALVVSAIGAVGETLFGLGWLGLPTYIISLAIVFGRPISEYSKEFPSEPFRVGAS